MIDFFLRTFTQSAFSKNFITLISGTVIAQGFSFLLLIVLQRWFYAPEDFGVLSFFVSFSSIFISISTLKYEYAIVVEKDQKVALSLAILCFIGVTLFSIFSLLILFLFPSYLLKNISPRDITLFKVSIPLMILFAGMYETLNFWNNAENKFSRISYSRIFQSTSMELTRLLLAPLNWGGKALIIGRLTGQFFSSLFLLRPFLRNIRSSQHLIDFQLIKKTANRYRDFPLFTMPTIGINNFTTWLFVYLFYGFYGSAVMGLVSIAIQYIALPFNIISGAFSQVFFKKISDIDNRNSLMNVYKSFCLRLSAIGAVGIVIAFLIPDRLILFVLGENWNGLGTFMRIAILWQTIAFISSSLSFIYTRLLKQRLMVFYALLQLLIVYVTLRIGNKYFDSPIETFQFFVAGQIAYYLFAIVSAFHFIRKTKVIS